MALPYRGVVSERELLDIYERKWWLAVRVAATICGADAEDVVQNVALYLWRRLDTLTAISAGFFIRSVKQKAIARKQSAWHRHMIPMAPDDLLVVEKFHVREGRERGGVRRCPCRRGPREKGVVGTRHLFGS